MLKAKTSVLTQKFPLDGNGGAFGGLGGRGGLATLSFFRTSSGISFSIASPCTSISFRISKYHQFQIRLTSTVFKLFTCRLPVLKSLVEINKIRSEPSDWLLLLVSVTTKIVLPTSVLKISFQENMTE